MNKQLDLNHQALPIHPVCVCVCVRERRRVRSGWLCEDMRKPYPLLFVKYNMYISFHVYFRDDLIEGEQTGSVFQCIPSHIPRHIKTPWEKKKKVSLTKCQGKFFSPLLADNPIQNVHNSFKSRKWEDLKFHILKYNLCSLNIPFHCVVRAIMEINEEILNF